MRITGEIVNCASVAAGQNLVTIARAATGDLLLFFVSGTPILAHTGKALAFSKSCPKNGDVPKSSFLPIGSHSAHRQARFRKINVGSYRGWH
jgi:hypothetical protein